MDTGNIVANNDNVKPVYGLWSNMSVDVTYSVYAATKKARAFAPGLPHS
jgi:hypothetical protein